MLRLPRWTAWALLLAVAAPAAAQTTLSPAEFLELRRQAYQLFSSGDYAEAAPLYERLHAAYPEDGVLLNNLAICRYRLGDETGALGPFVEAIEMGHGTESRSAYAVAQAHARAGRSDEALRWLERSLAARYDNRPQLQSDEAFESLRSHPRFRELAGFLPEREFSRVEGWRHDLAFYLEEVRRLHADPERVAHSAAFQAAVEDLSRRVPELLDTEVVLELQLITATLGDGHSVVYPIPSERLQFASLPLEFYFFADGLHVVDAAEAHRDLIGSRVVAMNGRDTGKVLEELRPFVSRDNDQGILWLGPRYLTGLGVLRRLGYAPAEGPVPLTVVDARGRRRTVRVEAGSARLDPKLNPPPDTPAAGAPLWLRQVDETHWFTPLSEMNAVYAQLNQVAGGEDGTLADFAADVRGALVESDARHLILDLRHNNGGNNFLIWPLVRLVAWHGASGDDHETYVITGRATFSACQNLVNYLDRVTQVTFVGEPSSSKPNFVGESTNALLPWSGLRLSISSRYWQDSFPEDRRPFVSVIMPVKLTAGDWRANRDPVLENLREVLR